MKPICAACRLFFRPKKNGVAFEEGMPTDEDTWAPYKLWMGDLWACKGCGAEIIVGTGRGPIAEHYDPSYERMRARLTPLFRVDDC